jgi:hypothetical protein
MKVSLIKKPSESKLWIISYDYKCLTFTFSNISVLLLYLMTNELPSTQLESDVLSVTVTKELLAF